MKNMNTEQLWSWLKVMGACTGALTWVDENKHTMRSALVNCTTHVDWLWFVFWQAFQFNYQNAIPDVLHQEWKAFYEPRNVAYQKDYGERLVAYKERLRLNSKQIRPLLVERDMRQQYEADENAICEAFMNDCRLWWLERIED